VADAVDAWLQTSLPSSSAILPVRRYRVGSTRERSPSAGAFRSSWRRSARRTPTLAVAPPAEPSTPASPPWKGKLAPCAIPDAGDGYCGTYEVDSKAGFVVHHVDLEKSPANIGINRKRWFTLEGNRLSLKIDAAELPATQKESRLVWERVR